jgi:thioredoxin reductase (NADPH)
MSAIATHISVEPGSEAFPLLTPAQIERLRPHGKLRHVEAGEVLFEPGDSNVPVYLVLSGGLEILQPCPKDVRTLVRHVPGSITGEFAVISGQRALLRGQVIASGDFLQIASGEFRALVAKDAELGDILMKAYILRRMLLISEEASNVLVLGSLNCANTLRLREFLSRNGYPYKFIDLDTDERSQSILDHFQVKVDEVPVVICNGRSVLRNPSIRELADCLGLNMSIDESQVRDLIVVGAGPSGLAAAVYAASEGLNVLVVETGSPGGQAGSSSRIENYLGFPMGISGQELAGRALAQAQKFGANMMIARTAEDDVQLGMQRVRGFAFRGAAEDGDPVPALEVGGGGDAGQRDKARLPCHDMKRPLLERPSFTKTRINAVTIFQDHPCIAVDHELVGRPRGLGLRAQGRRGQEQQKDYFPHDSPPVCFCGAWRRPEADAA